jgi:LPS sulfotransferase NodH
MRKKSNQDDLLQTLFARLDLVQRDNVKPIRKIAIFSTPRSGSTHFCNALSNTQKMGEPLEWFNNRFLDNYLSYFKKKDFKLVDYVDFIFTKTSSDSGTFSTKILVEQYLYFLNVHKFDLLSLNFDEIILVDRRDKIAQAYSYSKALVTDQWSSLSKSYVNLNPVDIKNSSILKSLHHIATWEEFFESHLSNKLNFKYTYEDFIKSKNFPLEVLNDLKISVASKEGFKFDLQKQTTQDDLLRIKEFRKSLKLN